MNAVDVLAVMEHEIDRAGGVHFEAGRALIEARAAVVEIIAERDRLANIVRSHERQIDGDDHA